MSRHFSTFVHLPVIGSASDCSNCATLFQQRQTCENNANRETHANVGGMISLVIEVHIALACLFSTWHATASLSCLLRNFRCVDFSCCLWRFDQLSGLYGNRSHWSIPFLFRRCASWFGSLRLRSESCTVFGFSSLHDSPLVPDLSPRRKQMRAFLFATLGALQEVTMTRMLDLFLVSTAMGTNGACEVLVRVVQQSPTWPKASMSTMKIWMLAPMAKASCSATRATRLRTACLCATQW